jgi:hypothetical protein
MLAKNLKAVLDHTPADRIVIIAQWPVGDAKESQAFDLHACETVHVTNHRRRNSSDAGFDRWP